ncbi:hypothetical protein NL676_026883 [Syzygium grande]|nr:hypothetical protein NL676_026883 [Syzygium grande]
MISFSTSPDQIDPSSCLFRFASRFISRSSTRPRSLPLPPEVRGGIAELDRGIRRSRAARSRFGRRISEEPELVPSPPRRRRRRRFRDAGVLRSVAAESRRADLVGFVDVSGLVAVWPEKSVVSVLSIAPPDVISVVWIIMHCWIRRADLGTSVIDV